MKKTFTLIELIVVIVIIAVLTAIIAPVAFVSIEKARVAKLLMMVRNFKTACSTYYIDTSKYAFERSSAEEWKCNRHQLSVHPNADQATHPAQCSDTIIGWDGPYIEKVLTNGDSPYNNRIVIEDRLFDPHQNPPEAGSYPGGVGFDFDSDGAVDPDTTQAAGRFGNYVTFWSIPESVAKRVNDAIDGASANWKDRGQVEYNDLSDNDCYDCLAVYLNLKQ